MCKYEQENLITSYYLRIHVKRLDTGAHVLRLHRHRRAAGQLRPNFPMFTAGRPGSSNANAFKS